MKVEKNVLLRQSSGQDGGGSPSVPALFLVRSIEQGGDNSTHP